MTEGYCSNFSVAVVSPDSSVEPIASPVPMRKMESAQVCQAGDQIPVIQSQDMFFSCCDWESAMVQESRNKLDYHEVTAFNTDCKRVRKMADKEERPVSSFFEQSSTFDVDTVMNKAG